MKDIPGWFNFADIYDKAVKDASDGAVFVELGAFLGKSTAYMAQKIKESGKIIDFYTVDMWIQYATFRREEIQDFAKIKIYSDGSLFRTFIQNMCDREVLPFIKPIQLPSELAANLFKDFSVDFLFVDAAHNEHAVTRDLKAWERKVKPGSIWAGHDYTTHQGVRLAVDEFFVEGVVQTIGSSWLVQL